METAERRLKNASKVKAEAFALSKAASLANSTDAMPRIYSCNFIEPGIVNYHDIGTVLVTKDTLTKMAESFVGKPVVNVAHKDIDPSQFGDQADGIVTDVWFNPEDGWYWCEFMVWDQATQLNCESKAYSVSCAYSMVDGRDVQGSWHNIPYVGEITDGEYTHLAVVDNPRYEGARIVCNSKNGGTSMSLKFWKSAKDKKERTNAVEISPEKPVTVDGKKVSFLTLVNAFKAAEAEKLSALENDKELDDDTPIEIDGKEMPLRDLKDLYRLRAKAEDELKNAEDDEKKKKEEEEEKEKARKNAEDAKKKEDDEKEKKKAEDLKNAKHFEDVKNAARMNGAPQQPKIVTMADREEAGRAAYGSDKPKKQQEK